MQKTQQKEAKFVVNLCTKQSKLTMIQDGKSYQITCSTKVISPHGLPEE